MTNAEKIRTLNDKELACFIRSIYFNGSDGNGFAFCDYNLELWLNKEFQENKQGKFKIFKEIKKMS